MTGPNPRGIYFDSKLLPEPEYNYVCWLDVMGTANQMLRSLPIAANFIFKLQCAVLEAFEEVDSSADLLLYPVMDGVYITSRRRDPLQRILNQTLCRVAITFLNEVKPFHQFVVRGAIAFGPVYHGCDLDPQVSHVLARHEAMRDSMLTGYPMAQAYHAEREAPPFGIAVDGSARSFAPEGDRPFRFMWFDWYRKAIPPIDAGQLLGHLTRYFDWQAEHSNLTGYKRDQIEYHRVLAKEFFTLGEA